MAEPVDFNTIQDEGISLTTICGWFHLGGLKEDVTYYPEEGQNMQYQPKSVLKKGTAVFSTAYFRKGVLAVVYCLRLAQFIK